METIKSDQTGYDFHLIKFHLSSYSWLCKKKGCQGEEGRMRLAKREQVMNFRTNKRFLQDEWADYHPECLELVSGRNLVEKGLQENPIESCTWWPIPVHRSRFKAEIKEGCLINYPSLIMHEFSWGNLIRKRSITAHLANNESISIPHGRTEPFLNHLFKLIDFGPFFHLIFRGELVFLPKLGQFAFADRNETLNWRTWIVVKGKRSDKKKWRILISSDGMVWRMEN